METRGINNHLNVVGGGHPRSKQVRKNNTCTHFTAALWQKWLLRNVWSAGDERRANGIAEFRKLLK